MELVEIWRCFPAKNRRLPIVDIPFGNGTTKEIEISLKAKLASNELIRPNGWRKVILQLLSNKWLKRGEFKGATIFPTNVIFALESLGVKINNPWIIHGGVSDILCVENPKALNRYQQEKVDSKKLYLTGSPYQDILSDAINANRSRSTTKKGAIKKTKCVRVLVSWPPSYHDVHGANNEFDSYELMSHAVFSSLKKLPRKEIVVSLHPSCSKNINHLLNELGIKTTQRYIIEELVTADVFLSFCSSVFQWSLALGKPTFNYDMYNFNLDQYDEAQGYFVSTRFAEILDRIEAVEESTISASKQTMRRRTNSALWGEIDGKSCERIINIMDSFSVR